MRALRILVGLIAACAAFVPVPAHADALTGCSWPAGKQHVRLFVVDGVGWHVAHAIRAWDDVHRGQPRWVRVTTRSKADVVVETYRNAYDGYAGLTRYRCAPGTWMKATVLLNNAAPNLTTRDRRTTTVHELGHALGLGHRTCDCASVMHPDVREDTAAPALLDRRALGRLYR